MDEQPLYQNASNGRIERNKLYGSCEGFINEMITNERGQTKDVEERFIATVACKAAVKAHMDLSRAEVDNLINDLLSLKNPYTCPHGRPTAIKI